jgi:CheY-like chemotaxis protein
VISAPHILVVDDSPTYRKVLSDLLFKKGYQSTCAASSEEALKLLQDNEFNLVLTDIIMPGISGLNLLKMIKEHRPALDVVIVTSNASSFTAIKALRLGAYDFIVKPIDDDTILYNVVERTIEKQRLALENQRLIVDLSEKNQQLQEAVDMMKTVNRACAIISSTFDIGSILKHLVESAVEQLRAQKGYLLLLDKTGTEFTMKVSIGIDHNLAKTFRMSIGRGLSGLVAEKNIPLVVGTEIPKLLTEKILEEDFTGDLFTTPGILSVPLNIGEKVVGVVNVSGRETRRPFGDPEVEFVTMLANHAAIALTNAGNYYRLKKTGK